MKTLVVENITKTLKFHENNKELKKLWKVIKQP